MQVKWRHRAVGSSATNDVYNGEFGLAIVYYSKTGRHSISHKNSESGQDEAGRHDLKISNVIDSDAGTYFCIDKDGEGEETTAELIVISEYGS